MAAALLGALVALTACSAGAPSPAPAEQWSLVFRDDFSGPGLDTSAWGVYDGPGNGFTGPRDARNTFVRDGLLVLRTTPLEGRWYGAGVSNARGLVQQYGKYRVRLRFDRGRGVRAAVLLWPTRGWPPEIDFFEIPATDGRRRQAMLSNHFGSPPRHERAHVRADFTRWHVVGVEWTPDRLRFTLDDREVATMTEHVPAQPMWLALQTAQGDESKGGVRPGRFTPRPVDLEVDWVEAYALVGAPRQSGEARRRAQPGGWALPYPGDPSTPPRSAGEHLIRGANR